MRVWAFKSLCLNRAHPSLIPSLTSTWNDMYQATELTEFGPTKIWLRNSPVLVHSNRFWNTLGSWLVRMPDQCRESPPVDSTVRFSPGQVNPAEFRIPSCLPFHEHFLFLTYLILELSALCSFLPFPAHAPTKWHSSTTEFIEFGPISLASNFLSHPQLLDIREYMVTSIFMESLLSERNRIRTLGNASNSQCNKINYILRRVLFSWADFIAQCQQRPSIHGFGSITIAAVSDPVRIILTWSPISTGLASLPIGFFTHSLRENMEGTSMDNMGIHLDVKSMPPPSPTFLFDNKTHHLGHLLSL